MIMKKKILICGFGFMGQNHAATVFNSDDMELVGAVNPPIGRPQKPVTGNLDVNKFDWNKLADIPFYMSMPEAFDKCDFDAVLICSPTVWHASNAIECIKRGKAVFLEKPLCANSTEAADMIAELEKKNTVFHVGHCVRFFPEYRYLKQLCRENTCGKLKHLKLVRKTGVPSWGEWKNKDTSIGSVSGPVFDLNIHDVDFALHLAGVPQSVDAARETYAEKLFRSHWQYADGLTVEIEGGFANQSCYPFRAGFTAVFEEAVLEFNTLAAQPLVLSNNDKSVPVETDGVDGYFLELRAFADELSGKTQEHCSIQEAARAIEYCEKIISCLG